MGSITVTRRRVFRLMRKNALIFGDAVALSGGGVCARFRCESPACVSAKKARLFGPRLEGVPEEKNYFFRLARTESSWPAEPRSWLRLMMNFAYSSMKVLPTGRKSNSEGLSRKN